MREQMIQMKKMQYVVASLLAASVFTTAAEAANFNNEVKTQQGVVAGAYDDKHQVVKENRLKKLLEYRFRHLEDFHPSKFFFRETGINQVRYWDLFFGRKPINPEEYKAVAEYFNITISEAFDSLQLNLFEQ